MKNLLYIGNKLNGKKSNVTTMEVLGNHLQSEGCKIVYASSKDNKVWRLLDMVYSVFKNRETLDYVLIDTYSTQNFYYAFVISQLCRFFRLKYITILHGGNLPVRLQNNPRLSKYIFNYAYKIVSPSKFLKEAFANFGYNKVDFIPNTIQINNYPYQFKSIDKPKLFWLRSFKALYNPKMAIKVASLLKADGIDFELCMIGPDGGDGSLAESLKLAKELNVEVDFRGKLSKSEWISLSKNSNIFINTTNFDNMPVSVIEAMALGFTVVSTNVGGLPYLIEDGMDGLLVDENNANQMAQRIINLVNNTELAQHLSINARKKAEGFDWKVVGDQWKDLLKIT